MFIYPRETKKWYFCHCLTTQFIAKMDNDYLDEPPTGNNWKSNIAVIILSVLLIVVVVHYFTEKNARESIVKDMNHDKDSLKVELTHMAKGYDSLKTNNDTINQNLQGAQSRVLGLLSEIQQVKSASYGQLSKYRSEVGTLRNIMRNYIVQIDSLNRRNEILMSENRQVKTENVNIKYQNQTIQGQKADLEKKVAKASVLDATGVVAEAVSNRNKVVNRVRKTEKIRINMNISKNVTSSRGTKNIYVRISRPDQKVLENGASGSFKFEGSKIPYSSVRQIEYEGNELPVSIYFDATQSQLIPGVYVVDVFAEGNNIATTRFSLK